MDNLLDLNKGTATQRINTLGHQLFESSGLEFTKNTNLLITIAGTYGNDNGYTTGVEIGTYELEHAKDGRFHLSKNNIKISDKVFTTIVLNMYHEKAHCIQKNDLFRQTHLDADAANQLTQEIACMDNHDYYFDNGNYKINANEIQAEHYGIMNVYKYLCNEFTKINPADHEHIILDIVNDKMMNSTYFVSSEKPFRSLSEVEKAFDDAYDISFVKKRTYMVNSSNTHDVVKLFMREHPEAKEAYLNADSPLEQDRCIASINLKLHPKWIEAYSALSDMDLSYENIIEKPYQETQASRIERIHSMFGDVLANDNQTDEYNIEVT